jgi:hypothetical protein
MATTVCMATSSKDKDLIVDYGEGKASVDVTCEHTLADVRRLICEDWDDDMLPDQDVEWAFWVVDRRITGRKKAWDFIGGDNIRIQEVIDKNKNKKRPAVDAASKTPVNNNNNSSKRQKIKSHASASTVVATGLQVQSAAVSPAEETAQLARTNHPSSEHKHEEFASEAHGCESSSSQNLESDSKQVTNHIVSSSSSSDEEMSRVAVLHKPRQVATPSQSQLQSQPSADDEDDNVDSKNRKGSQDDKRVHLVHKCPRCSLCLLFRSYLDPDEKIPKKTDGCLDFDKPWEDARGPAYRYILAIRNHWADPTCTHTNKELPVCAHYTRFKWGTKIIRKLKTEIPGLQTFSPQTLHSWIGAWRKEHECDQAFSALLRVHPNHSHFQADLTVLLKRILTEHQATLEQQAGAKYRAN